MNTYIFELLIDIERRMQEILDELRSMQEQVFYDCNPNEICTEEIPVDVESDRQQSFEYLINKE